MSGPASEFEIIARHFAPLAAGSPVGLGLRDDAAILEPPPGARLALTTDTCIEGVHFLAGGEPGVIARRLLRVNLSDLAAMGARPLGYLLSFGLDHGRDEAWIAAFAAGLAADQAEFGVALFGGDTVATPGPLSLTITAVGALPRDRALRRAAATAGDTVFVTGSIGDAALGLRHLRGELTVGEAAGRELAARYWLPTPRLAVGQALLEVAHAAADVSDGLAADLGHIAEASGLGAVLEAARVPLSPAAAAAVRAEPGALVAALTGGDDYELVFTAPPTAAARVAAIAAAVGVPITAVGRMIEGAGVRVIDAAGRPVEHGAGGFRHF